MDSGYAGVKLNLVGGIMAKKQRSEIWFQEARPLNPYDYNRDNYSRLRILGPDGRSSSVVLTTVGDILLLAMQ